MSAVAYAVQCVFVGMTFGVLIGAAIQRAKRRQVVLPLEGKIVRLEADRDERRAEVERLQQLVYVPGLWRCPKCQFNLMRTELNVATGTARADDTPGEKCPNCQSPLWRVTERDAGNGLAKRCESMQERLNEHLGLAHALTILSNTMGNPALHWDADVSSITSALIEEAARRLNAYAVEREL